MRITFLLLFVLSFTARGQASNFYQADGVLKADSHFKINKFSLSRATAIEQLLIPLIEKSIHYPKFARDNDMSGNLIVKFSTRNGQVKYDVVEFSDKIFKDAVVDFLNAQEQSSLLKIFNSDDKVVFYLPIEFVFVNEDERNTDNPNALVIKIIKTNRAKI
jgi:hypothetical protein